MDEQPDILHEVKLYMDAAHEELRSSKSNLENDFYNTCASRTYYAVFYAATAVLKPKDCRFQNKQLYLAHFASTSSKQAYSAVI